MRRKILRLYNARSECYINPEIATLAGRLCASALREQAFVQMRIVPRANGSRRIVGAWIHRALVANLLT
jgi:hypothetical protein